MEGGLLRNVLKAHRSALRIVYFNEITLDSVPEWRRVLEILRSGRIRRFELAWLRYSVPEAGVLELAVMEGPGTLLRENGGRAHLWGDFAEAVRTGVQPALEIIPKRLEN